MPAMRVLLYGRPGADGGLLARLAAKIGALPGVVATTATADRALSPFGTRVARILDRNSSPGGAVVEDAAGDADLVLYCGGRRDVHVGRPRLGAFAFDADLAEGLALWRAAGGADGALTLSLLHAPDGDGAYVKVDEAVAPAKPSMARSLAVLRECAALLAVRAIRLLSDGSLASGSSTDAPNASLRVSSLAAYGGRVAAAGAARLVDAADTRIRWRLGRLAPRFELFFGAGDPVTGDFFNSHRAQGPAGSYLADPFLIEHGGGLHVFFERYDLAAGRGVIGVARVEDGRFRLLGDALVEDIHLSYPFVFEHEGAVYMIPETVARRRVEIWRAVDFPWRWTLEATALEGVAAVDTTLLQHDGAWWVFVNRAEGGAADGATLLELYRADGPLLRRLEPHNANPVVIDARRARNGGRPFRRNGRLFRPAQHNAASVYGYALNIMEITALDARRYEERCVRTIVGCHHLDVAGDQFVFDVRRDGDRKRFGKCGTLSNA